MKNKFRYVALLLMCVCVLPLVFACNGGNGNLTFGKPTYTVTKDGYYTAEVKMFNQSEDVDVVLNKSDFYIMIGNKKLNATNFITGYSYSGGTSGEEYTSNLSDTFTIQSHYEHTVKIAFDVDSWEGGQATLYYKGKAI